MGDGVQACQGKAATDKRNEFCGGHVQLNDLYQLELDKLKWRLALLDIFFSFQLIFHEVS